MGWRQGESQGLPGAGLAEAVIHINRLADDVRKLLLSYDDDQA